MGEVGAWREERGARRMLGSWMSKGEEAAPPSPSPWKPRSRALLPSATVDRSAAGAAGWASAGGGSCMLPIRVRE